MDSFTIFVKLADFWLFLAKMAEILGIIKNGLLWLTLAPFYAEYATFIQKLQNFYDICKNG